SLDFKTSRSVETSIFAKRAKLVSTQNTTYRDYLAIINLKSCQRGQIETRSKLAKINNLNSQLTTKQITAMQFLEFATNLDFNFNKEGNFT
ncbi:Protein of unknown function, partial [Cotesia congregata]